MSFLDRIAPYRKAVAGFLVPGLVALAAALADGHVTAVEWVTIALAAVGTSGTVYAVANSPAAPAASTTTSSSSGTIDPGPPSTTPKHL